MTTGPIPTSRTIQPVGRLVEYLADQATSALGPLAEWRARIVANSATDTQDAMDQYNRLMGLVGAVEASKGANGLTTAYISQYPTLVADYDLLGSWTLAKTDILALTTGIRNVWPEKSPSGYPATHRWNATTLLSETFSIPLTGGTKTSVLNMIDAVQLRFTT